MVIAASVANLIEFICEGDSIFFNNQYLTTTGQYSAQLIASNGCDSLVLVTVRVLEPATVSLSGDGVVCADGLLPLIERGVVTGEEKKIKKVRLYCGSV